MVVLEAIERTTLNELWIVLSVITLCLLTYKLFNIFRVFALGFSLPGPRALPLIGNCLLIKEKDLLRNRAATAFKDYGSLIRIWVTLFPIFLVIEPDDLQKVLSSQKHTDKIFFYKLLQNFLGNGLITNSGMKWASHRRYIQPSFHIHILEKFVHTFTDSAQCFFDKLTVAPQTLNITSFVNDCVLDILNESVMGVPVMQKDKSMMEQSPFRQGKVVIPYRVTRPWLLFSFIYNLTDVASQELSQKNALNSFTKKMIKLRRDAKARGELPSRKCLLDFMIEISENHPDFTEEDIVDEACTFMLAGQDSVGAAIAFLFFLLAQNQEDQKKCINELDGIFGTDDRVPTMTDLREMRYLEMCIKETLRLYPSVPLLARKISEPLEIAGRTLPEGSEIFICPYSTHRLPHIYPDPEKFDPERFSPENCEKRNPYAYLPFSAGPRKCMGDKFAILEIKTVVSKVLRSYHLHPVAGKTSIEPVFRITLRASGGLWVHLEPRSIKAKTAETNPIKSTQKETIIQDNFCKINGKINGLNGLNGAKHISVT